MTDEDRIRELLEEALNSESTLEQVCAEFPDLLPEVRRRWRRMRRVARGLDALFPPSISGDSAQKAGWTLWKEVDLVLRRARSAD